MAKEILSLIRGYKDFQSHYFDNDHPLFDQLRQGQKPKVLVIACSDSRVDPAIVTNSQPGDLFVIRNVANLVPPYEEDQGYHGTSAALEFGVCALGIRHIVVFGHTQCGGIAHLFDPHAKEQAKNSFIPKWMTLARGAYRKTIKEGKTLSLEESVVRCSQHSLVHSLENLMTFPWIAQKVADKQLFLHAWQFNIATGVVLSFDHESGCFAELSMEKYPL